MARTKGVIKGSNGDNRTGTLIDSRTGDVYVFDQPFLRELGLIDGTEVFYDTVDISGKFIAVSLDNVAKGQITSIMDSETGIVKELATGKEMKFRQPYVREAGMTVGSLVKFEKINTPTDGETAVLLALTKKNG
jgi:hypothetical protein